MPHASTRRRATIGLATAAIVVGAGSLAGAAGPDLSVNGGARQTTGDNSAALAKAIDRGKAKNVILLIGDGMGDSEITSARNYAKGAAGRFAGIDALPLTGQYTTYSLYRAGQPNAGKPDYVPDSSATGTAWATGTKTYDNAVSVDINGAPQQTLLELAKSKGLKTGDITTSEIQDATPAVQVSHISQRACYGPDNTRVYAAGETKPADNAYCPEADLARGGAGSITEQALATKPDVLMGGGASYFSQKSTGGPYAGKTLAEQATARGYQTVTDLDGLTKVAKADQTTPLLGLFAPKNLPVRYTGPAATAGGDKLPAVTCTPNASRPDTQPKLSEMTTKAIALLDNPNGFFLQVEGASIDKQDHSSDACGQIGEVVDLDEAVQVALDYAKKQGNTSVFVTADHAHTSQIVEVVPSSGTSTTPGKTVTLQTADGVPMAISYATSTGSSQQHTGTQLRIAGYGPKAANIVGLTDQTDLNFTIKEALFGTDGNPTPPAPTPGPSSDGASVVLRPGTVRPGQNAFAFGRGFLADSQVRVTIDGPGKPVTTVKPVTSGSVVASVKGRKKGTYTVTLTGVTSGKSVSDTLRVKR